jgi:hypothetical protein
MENKNILRKRSLVDQEWHLALEMPTSETAHVGRERERTHLQNNLRNSSHQEGGRENTPAWRVEIEMIVKIWLWIGVIIF